MKKLTVLILALALCLLCACGNSKENDDQKTPSNETQPITVQPTGDMDDVTIPSQDLEVAEKDF